MKLLIATLLLIALGTMAQNSGGYVRLSATTINNSRLIRDLRQLGAEYTLEQGIFRKTPRLPNGSWQVTQTESVFRRTTSEVTYYRYTVQIQSQSAPTLIRATYTISFRRANGNTLITANSYRIISDNPEGPFLADLPSFIDLRQLTSGSDLSKYLNQGVEYTVAQARANNQIRPGTYRVGRTFGIQDTGFSFPYGYNFLTTIVNRRTGYTYRVRIFVYVTEGDFPPTYTIYPNS